MQNEHKDYSMLGFGDNRETRRKKGRKSGFNLKAILPKKGNK